MTAQEKELLISCLEDLHGCVASLASTANNYSKIIHEDLDATRHKIEAFEKLLTAPVWE